MAIQYVCDECGFRGRDDREGAGDLIWLDEWAVNCPICGQPVDRVGGRALTSSEMHNFADGGG
jgi:predicted RNA-binding Zn-ribbon protein involved in translation (DUF1610 family)